MCAETNKQREWNNKIQMDYARLLNILVIQWDSLSTVACRRTLVVLQRLIVVSGAEETPSRCCCARSYKYRQHVLDIGSHEQSSLGGAGGG